VMTIAAGTAGMGILLTRLLPEPSGLTLDELSGDPAGAEELVSREAEAPELTTAAV